MIKIVNTTKPNVSYTLLQGNTYAVGRKQGEIVFPDDQSISRNHGEILVEHPAANVTNAALTPTVCIVDFGSKFGTFANEGIQRKTSLAMREKLYLSPGDKFKFGLQWNEFKIEYTPLVATSSAVNNTLQLKQYMCKLGGHLVNDWTLKCDYVIMEAITLTVKAVCALLSGKRIVKPEFFSTMIERIQKGLELPNPADFLPTLAENALKSIPVSFEPKVARSKIFDGKIFMFTMGKNMKKVELAIKCGGGSCCLITSVSDSELTAPHTVLIGLMGDDPCGAEDALKAIETYKKAGKRVVPESEIGLAALHCSANKHCNPLYSFKKAIFPPRMTTQTQSSSSSLPSVNSGSFKPVAETQDIPTQLSTSSHSESISVVEETLNTTASGRPKTQLSSIEVLDISNEDMDEPERPGPSRKSTNSKGKRDNDIEILPISKRRLPQTSPSESFVEPSIKRPRTKPITENKTLSSLFASSDEDEDEASMEGISNLRSPPSSLVSESLDQDVKHKNDQEQLNSLAKSSSNTQVPTTSGTIHYSCDTQEDLFPTDVSRSGKNSTISNVSVKRKIEDEEIMQPPKGKSRKIEREHKTSSIEQKVADIDLEISNKLVLKTEDEPTIIIGDDKVESCPTIFVKGLIVEKRPSSPAPKGKDGQPVVNFKRFRKVTPLNTSFRANSVQDDSMAPIRLVIQGEENRKFFEIPDPQMEEDSPIGEKINEEELFVPPTATASTSVDEPRPRRTTRASSSSPSKPGPSRPANANVPVLAKNNMNESEIDFEKHVDGPTRVTRSRAPVAVPTRKPKKPEEDDLWSF